MAENRELNGLDSSETLRECTALKLTVISTIISSHSVVHYASLALRKIDNIISW